MSKFVIETYQRDQGYLALALPLNASINEAGIGADASERRAMIGAIHSYFNRKENSVAAPAPVTRECGCEEVRPPLGGTTTGRFRAGEPNLSGPVTRNVAVDETTITRVLREAVEDDSGAKFEMSYVDVGGNPTTRHILPVSIDGPLVFAIDLVKDAMRTFRFDRIERLEAV